MSGEAKPCRVAWLLSRTPDSKRAPRPQHKDWADHTGAVAHKQRLHRQYGDAVTVCVTPTPAPRVRIEAAKPPPVVTEERNSVFWVSAFVPRRNSSRAIVQHHRFADRDRAEARKACGWRRARRR